MGVKDPLKLDTTNISPHQAEQLEFKIPGVGKARMVGFICAGYCTVFVQERTMG